MKRVLIAGLGKGMIDRDSNERDYRKANYRIQNEDSETYTIYENEYFVTSALEKHCNIDKTIYIGTAGSMWDKLYIHYCEKKEIAVDEEYRKEIRSITENANKNTDINLLDTEKFKSKFPNVEIIITKYGMDETEIFENFTEIMEIINSLDKDDEIYLDITHSFRSNAMWMFLVMNYITDVIDKNIKIKTITYGMLEELDTDTNTEGNSIKVASVINLKPFYDLMRWIKGANAFKEYGNSYDLLELMGDNQIKNNIKNFSDGLNLNYVGAIKQNIKSLKNLYNQINIIDGPAKLIIPNVIKNFLENFKKSEKDYEILLELANWYFIQKKYGMVAVNINECIRNFIIYIFELDNTKKSTGKNVKNHFFYSQKKLNFIKYKNELEKKEHRLCRILFKSQDIRNDVSHSLGERVELNNDIKYLEDSIAFLRDILYNKKFISYYENKYLNGLLAK